MSKLLFSLTTLVMMISTPLPARTSPEISYTVGFSEPNSHLIRISVTVSSHGRKELTFRLPAWRPGRYAIQNYSRLVQEVKAVSENGNSLPVRRESKDAWVVSVPGMEQVTFSYRFFANILDAGSTLYTQDEIYINGSNCLVWVEGLQALSPVISFEFPDGWKTATGLKRNQNGSFTARDYEELIDCPVIISPDLVHEEIKVREIPIHLWVQGKTNGNLSRLAKDIGKIAEAQFGFWDGIVPFSEFHFLIHLVDYRSGHGVEHRNSTSLVIGPLTDMPDPNDFSLLLGTASHEFFHAWNVKKLIPADLVPYDLTKEQYTTFLWFSEGFTSYYDNYLNFKAGLMTEEGFFREMATQLKSQEQNPGRKITSLSEASFDSWLTGYSTDGNRNKSVNFYGAGELTAFFADLKIRTETGGKKSLRDVMLLLYRETVPSGKGFTRQDLLQAFKTVSGVSFEDFFSRYIDGTEPFPAGDILEAAGLTLTKELAPPTFRTALGIDLRRVNSAWVIDNVLPGSPGFKAGLDFGDILIGSENNPVPDSKPEDWLQKLDLTKPLQLDIKRKGQTKHLSVPDVNPDNFTYKITKNWFKAAVFN
ncbi:MAG: hypothetical protein L6Q77_05710 [Bacteroidetes bacterium]|nr:hypothetical protein [Bacteroidota bacterium]